LKKIFCLLLLFIFTYNAGYGNYKPLSISLKELEFDKIIYHEGLKPLAIKSVAVGRALENGTLSKEALDFTGWVHPSVMYFEKAWKGHHYWMAITPYPKGDNQYENPHIFCSNNGKDWKEPAGIKNPLVPAPEGKAYNSDVNLLFDKGILYCYYRLSSPDTERSLRVIQSKDGLQWRENQQLSAWAFKGIDMISPSVVRAENKYYCYAVSTGEHQAGSYFKNNAIRHMISNKRTLWNAPIRELNYPKVNLTNRPWSEEFEPWHLEVQKLGNIWLMLVTTTRVGSSGSQGSLYFGYSLNGLDFTFSHALTKDLGTYKSSFLAHYNPYSKALEIKIWRGMMTSGWRVFYDECIIPVKLG